MFGNKMKSEKVELVKRIIRLNNYRDYERTHSMCVDAGIHINRIALDRFADKLELIDKAEQAKAKQQAKKRPSSSTTSNADMSYEQIKQREAEITFELGALRIKENELLKELASLSDRAKNKH